MAYLATYRRTRRWLACVPILCSALVALPTAALARSPHTGGGGSGGTGLGGGSGSTTSTSSPTTKNGAAQVVHIHGVVNASGDGITFKVAASGTLGHPLAITGEAPDNDVGQTIDIESARPTGLIWTQVATAVIGSSGAFSAQWTPATSAQVDLRAVLAAGAGSANGSQSTSGGGGLSGGRSASTASAAIATAPVTIPIFRAAKATIYGPGFWGHRTACGQRLTRATLGVASRTLKCGTRVAVFYKGREITVPVIDRGPFANGASWDLTMATAKALDVSETVIVGTLSPAPAAATSALS
jgi:rare lipoprotein A